METAQSRARGEVAPAHPPLILWGAMSIANRPCRTSQSHPDSKRSPTRQPLSSRLGKYSQGRRVPLASMLGIAEQPSGDFVRELS